MSKTIVSGLSPVKHDEDAEYHEGDKPCVGRITIQLTEDQTAQLTKNLRNQINENCTLKPLYRDWRKENAFLQRIITKLAKAKS